VRAWRTGPRRPGRRRHEAGASGAPPPRPRRFSPRQTRWILLRPADALDADEQAYRQALVEDFGRIVRGRAHAELDAWLAAAARSRIAELVSFARGIRRDRDAVAAALRSPYSQGQVEGHTSTGSRCSSARPTGGRTSTYCVAASCITPPDRGTAIGQEPIFECRSQRERVIRIFPNRESTIRLLGAVLLERHEQWTTGHRYFDMATYWQWRQEQQASPQQKAIGQ
jgi:Transposase/Transposase, Mutator family